MPTPLKLSTPEREEALEHLRRLPDELRAAVAGLSNTQLDTPYRDGGWTVRQVVHHVAESYMNAFIRVKLALTEDNPSVKPYEEDRWARLPDSVLRPAAGSQPDAAGRPARPPAAGAGRRDRLEPPVDAPRAGPHLHAGHAAGDVRLARAAPCPAHHGPA
ncbi:DinB family protein [Deinococcus frigens]|uniref:DinB family protein n=1 Tax=Deinococcus frigens TaxID=249403 RepID=UPI0039F13599